MNDELIGVISNEGELEGVIEDDNFNVKVQITESGPRGLPGSDGYTPIKGIDYFDGIDGEQGIQGEKGTDGKDGYTPQKGVDYYTDADKAEMVSVVLAALPVYEGEVESV